jgi:hypothetical protein
MRPEVSGYAEAGLPARIALQIRVEALLAEDKGDSFGK